MKKSIFTLLFAVVTMLFAGCASTGSGTKVVMETTAGTMEFVLYDETPKHRDNFIKLAQEQYFDSLLFHRVIKDFMIQGGDPDSKYAEAGVRLGEVVNARFEPSHALVMARKKEDFRNVVDLDLSDGRAEKYLRGGTWESDGKNGWCAVLLDGYPLGLGKRANGTVKRRHLPSPKHGRLIPTASGNFLSTVSCFMKALSTGVPPILFTRSRLAMSPPWWESPTTT
jgi:NOL1/NOP2/fmu family ribosome biogenesis protein